MSSFLKKPLEVWFKHLLRKGSKGEFSCSHNQIQEEEAMGELGDIGKRIHTFSYKISKFWGFNEHWQPTLVLLPGKFHGQRSLVGYSPRGRKESDTTEWLHFTSLHDDQS